MKHIVNIIIKAITILILIALTNPIYAQQDDALFDILENEMTREFNELQEANYPPYYIDYRVDHIKYVVISASFGSLNQSQKNEQRLLTTNVKVGNYNIDDSHPVNNSSWGYNSNYKASTTVMPIENEPAAIKNAMWQATSQEYKSALEAFKTVKSNHKIDSTHLADFSKENPEMYLEPSPENIEDLIDKSKWEEKVKRFSKAFLRNPDILSGDVALSFYVNRKYFISTEGAKIVQNITHAYLNVSGTILAEDGDILPIYRSYFAFKPENLPEDNEIENDLDNMITKLEQLKEAPLAEPYTGPAILHARSAAVFFHEIFGHRVEGHRLKNEDDGQTFKSKVNKQVLPASMDIIFDPTKLTYKDQDLIGAYKYDDQGIKSRKVNVVEDGILKNFLMSRSPLKNFPNSNGHGRAAMGNKPVSRQSNLIVNTDEAISMQTLRAKLIKECKKQNKAYGYLFKDVIGGFTHTSRYTPNVFNVIPTEVYKIYVDGRPDELVRGVDLIGTPLAMFAEIQAAGETKETFTGYCGAESGSVPVSAISPALLVRRIETQKKPKQNFDPPLLKRPVPDNMND